MHTIEDEKNIKEYEKYILRNGIDRSVIDAYCEASKIILCGRKDREYGLKVSTRAKELIFEYIKSITNGADFNWLETQSQKNKQSYDILDKYYDLLLYEAPYILDSYILYIEKNRPKKERFYEPRRKTLKQVADKLQELEDGKLDELFIHMPPRVGKSQIITLAMSWHCAKDAEKSNLYVTYKEGLGGAFLTGVMEIWTDPTYCFSDVFPKVKVADTDSKNHKVDLVRKKKYKTLSGKGLESGLNGEYDAYGWMVLDDILEGIQDVLNPDTLKRKQIIFDNNVMSRKKEQCKLIHNGTIWSLHDLYSDRLDFLQNNPEAKNIRYEILKIPALDENDESNFDYDYGVGYTTQYYRTLRAKFEENDDMASWYAQYQQEPIERDGAVFNPEHMRFYNGVLPEEEPYRICAACDVALGGEDFLAFAVAYMYEDGSIYIDDVVFDNSEKKITKPKVANMIIDNDVGSAFFEANQGGEGYKDEIEELLKKKGRKINLRSEYAPTNMRKAQRIWDKAGSIREFYFRDVGCRSQEYRKFMTNLYSFTVTGKNKHEDAADCLASLAYFIEGNWSMAKIEVPKNPFRGGYRNYGY
jgi:predicted phage terminase large subunit-like protein